MDKITVFAVLSLILSMHLLLTLSLNTVCFAADKPTVYVNPTETIDTALVPGKNFTVEVRVKDGVSLYGLELKVSWNNALLRYVSHTTLLGQPSGVLKSPVTATINSVFTDVGGNSFYWLIATSLYPAAEWSGSGTVARFTFEVKGTGWCVLDVYGTDLINYNVQRVSHYVEDGYFCNIEFQGDVDLDGKVGLSDLVLLAKAYGAEPSDPNWDQRCDFNNDWTIGLPDLVILAKNYGRTQV